MTARPLDDTTRRAHTRNDVYLKFGLSPVMLLRAEDGNLRLWKLTLTRGDSFVALPRPHVTEIVRCTKRGRAFVGV